MNSHPIGIFDSGLGGITLFNEIIKQLPYEDIIYFADSNNCPYGSKTQDEIISYSIKITDFLLEKKCKIIVVACNTATARAIDYLRAHYKIPFIGIEPAIKPAALKSKTGNIGVLATEGTFNGRLFNETKRKYTSGVKTHIKIGHGLVEIVEKLEMESNRTLTLLKALINPLLESKIDHLVLGCTHYPFLKEQIKKITGNVVTIVDPAPAVARQTKNILIREELINNTEHDPKYTFYTTGNQEILDKFVKSVSKIKTFDTFSYQI